MFLLLFCDSYFCISNLNVLNFLLLGAAQRNRKWGCSSFICLSFKNSREKKSLLRENFPCFVIALLLFLFCVCFLFFYCLVLFFFVCFLCRCFWVFLFCFFLFILCLLHCCWNPDSPMNSAPSLHEVRDP